MLRIEYLADEGDGRHADLVSHRVPSPAGVFREGGDADRGTGCGVPIVVG